tara:strand:+ start:291 stop:1166 length:876 start_codon:yes stop_codon:yes gene_type:complete
MSDKIDLTDHAADAHRLLTLETEIVEDLKAVFRIGMNLLEIRNEKLWQGNYKSFEDYCAERWQKGSNWARKMMKAVEVKEIVPIENEWQARQLSDLSDENKVEVFTRAVDEVSDPGLVTGTQLKRIKSSVLAEQAQDEDAPEIGKEEKSEIENSYRRLDEDFHYCLKSLHRIGTTINSIAAQKEGMWIDIDEFRHDLANLKGGLKMARPHAPCPYCSGTGVRDGAECTACHGLGWVPKSVFEEAPKSLQSPKGVEHSPLSYDSENYDPDAAATCDPRDNEDLDPGNDMPDY